MAKTQKDHKVYIANLEKVADDRVKELQLKNTSLQAEVHNERAINATIAQRVAILEKQCEDETVSASSSAFTKFS